MAKKYESDRIYHLQVKEGAKVIRGGIAYGHRGTLQVRGDEVEDLVAQGAEVVNPTALPDVGERHDVGEGRRP